MTRWTAVIGSSPSLSRRGYRRGQFAFHHFDGIVIISLVFTHSLNRYINETVKSLVPLLSYVKSECIRVIQCKPLFVIQLFTVATILTLYFRRTVLVGCHQNLVVVADPIQTRLCDAQQQSPRSARLQRKRRFERSPSRQSDHSGQRLKSVLETSRRRTTVLPRRRRFAETTSGSHNVDHR